MKHSLPPRHQSNTASERGILFDLVIGLLTISLLLVLRYQITPAFGPATIQIDERAPETKILPYFFDSVSEKLQITVPLSVSTIRPWLYAIRVDDCIETLSINGRNIIPDIEKSFCSPQSYATIPLGKYVAFGTNTLKITLTDLGGGEGMDIRASRHDPMTLLLFLALFLAIMWTLLRFPWIQKGCSRFSLPIKAILLLGVFLRILYMMVTPITERSYDVGGHLEYIQYVQDHWTIPHANDGWEFHQSPLYYFLMAILGKFVLTLGSDVATAEAAMQSISFLLSVCTLLLFFVASSLVLRTSRERFLAAAFVAVFPGFVFFASRVSNEALFVPLITLSVTLLFLWWQSGSRNVWVALSLVLPLAFLTKITTLSILPLVAVCWFVRHQKSGDVSKKTAAVLCVSFFVLLAGWLPVTRFLEPDTGNTLSFGNRDMNGSLQIPRGLRQYTTFNPAAVMQFPFNDPWTDSARRMNFFEYFFRSALFGEFSFPAHEVVARMIVVLGCLLLLPLFAGFLTSLRMHFYDWLPLHLLTFSVFGAAIFYSYVFPYSSNQDFRQSVILLLPFSCYVAHGICAFPFLLRWFFFCISALFVIASTTFFIPLFTSAG